MSIRLNLIDEAYIGALLLAQAGISPNNDREAWTEDDQYSITSVEIDVNGIYITNYGERIKIKVMDTTIL